MAKRTQRKWWLVSVDRTSVYRVYAKDADEASSLFTDDDEVDSVTTDMRSEVDADQLPPKRIGPREGPPTHNVRHTACRHCGSDIEGVAPFRRGQWRDRGNNRHCNDGKHVHAPVPEA